MTGFDKLTELLDRPLPADDRPDLDDAFAEESECAEDLAPGAAIVAFIWIWLAEHWPALAIGGAAGLLAIVIPAMILAPALAR